MAFINPCCCLNLRTGVLLIGIVEIISWSVAMKDSLTALWYTAAVSQIAVELQNENETAWNIDAGTEATLHTAFIISGISLSACVIKIVVACILVFGVQRNSVPMIGIWIIVKIVRVFFKIGVLIASMFYAPGAGYYTGHSYDFSIARPHSDLTPLALTFVYSLGIFLSVYFIWAAHSLIKQIHTEKDAGDDNGVGKNGKGGLVHKL